MKATRFLALLAILLLAGVSLFAQSTVSGALTGTVTSDGVPLPGATITITSPALQGSRTAVSDANGNYNFAALPPGDYKVVIALEGLQTVTRQVRVTLAGTARANGDLRVTAVSEAITVTASAPAVLETTEVQQNFQKETIDDLPVARNVTAIALLAPGTTANGPRGAIQISGATSNDNLIVVNGANVQENLRGQARPLFIEDAIQETTVITGAVSAEYGRFTGGVVSSITKSGGNEFTGTFRDSLSNPKWTAVSKYGEDAPESKINNLYEGTLGGYFVRDRLWFFSAGRIENSSVIGSNVNLTGENIVNENENTRYEVKLTGQITPQHSVVVNYLANPLTSTNNNQLGVYEWQALDPEIEQEEDFKAFHYNGIFGSNMLGEIHWSERKFTFVGFGGTNTDIYAGTPIFIGAATGTGQGVANAPYFCGICDDETRDNELGTAKLTWFLGTKNAGSHNIVGGVENFKESRLSNNYQSPTNVVVGIYQEPVQEGPNGLLYTWNTFDTIEYYPVMIPSIGSDLKTQSAFLNDKWDLNQNYSFNLGVRYDKTKAKDQEGNPTADESSISPRLGVTYDPKGDGALKLNVSYGRYVGRLAEGVQGAGSAAGSPWNIYYYYDGEPFTGTSAEVVKYAIDWWKARGGADYGNWTGDVPVYLGIGGVSTRLADSLASPSVDEYTVGGGWQISPTAYVRADFIHREWNDAYVQITNQSTGQVVEPITGAVSDLTLVDNSDLLEREYNAVQLSFNSRLLNRVDFGGNYTWSTLKGNYEGETTGNGPVSEGGWIFQYPEFQGFDANRPSGYLGGDQRHKLRAWVGTDFNFGNFGTLNVNLMERFDSGTPYSLAFTAVAQQDPSTLGQELTYVKAPQTVTYFLDERGSERWDDVTATDISLNYRIPVRGIEMFVEGDVLNVFNEQAQIAGNTSISRTATAFNPFTTTPVEGTHYRKSTSFGKARSAADYQVPRVYRVSLGLRF